jgi:hypothetical protein
MFRNLLSYSAALVSIPFGIGVGTINSDTDSDPDLDFQPVTCNL